MKQVFLKTAEQGNYSIELQDIITKYGENVNFLLGLKYFLRSVQSEHNFSVAFL